MGVRAAFGFVRLAGRVRRYRMQPTEFEQLLGLRLMDYMRDGPPFQRLQRQGLRNPSILCVSHAGDGEQLRSNLSAYLANAQAWP